jgi:serine/threonine-protein kinase HipA
MSDAWVRLWGTTIGAVALDEPGGAATFQYTDDFSASGIQVAPLMMPLSREVFSFPGLARQSFHGLPGMLSDSLPDKFGNAVIDAWLSMQGRLAESFDAVERLCYTGNRGMGALEFAPPQITIDDSTTVDMPELVELASQILTERENFAASLSGSEEDKRAAMRDIVRVSSSAGGARAKALIAWNERTDEIRSGQVKALDGFTYWLLKFDGITDNKDKELVDPAGYGLVEFAYYLMATAAGIRMTECRLLKENGRNHFMTKRFDRTDSGDKLHMQSLCGMAHYDFNLAGAYSYEQAMQVIRRLGLGMDAIEEQFRRMAFNVIARNHDDHTKNIAFLMDRSGKWSLSPAFDVIYSWNPRGGWTNQHQMSINGKRDNFTIDDFVACEKAVSLKRGRAKDILRKVQDTVQQWTEFAAEAGVPEERAREYALGHRKIKIE